MTLYLLTPVNSRRESQESPAAKWARLGRPTGAPVNSQRVVFDEPSIAQRARVVWKNLSPDHGGDQGSGIVSPMNSGHRVRGSPRDR